MELREITLIPIEQIDANIEQENATNLPVINNDSNEQDLLNLAEDFKSIMEEKDLELNLLKRKIINKEDKLKKIYGLICFLNDIFDNIDFCGDINGETSCHILEYLMCQFK